MIEITLPWPSRDLHQNARVHWSKRAKAAKSARLLAVAESILAGSRDVVLPPGRLHLWVNFYPPDRRHRDDDGLLGAFKSYRDGIADALGINDERFISHPYLSDEVRKDGQVVVKITGGPQ